MGLSGQRILSLRMQLNIMGLHGRHLQVSQENKLWWAGQKVYLKVAHGYCKTVTKEC